MSEYLVGIYKEIGKKPDIVKIKNQKEYLEKLLDGEYLTQDYDDYIKYLYELKAYLAEKTGKSMIDIEKQLSRMNEDITGV